jgi:hypothetical protein
LHDGCLKLEPRRFAHFVRHVERGIELQKRLRSSVNAAWRRHLALCAPNERAGKVERNALRYNGASYTLSAALTLY